MYIQDELRRIVNRLFGSTPYDIISFDEINRIAHDENRRGLDYPESFTGILYQESGTWANYEPMSINLAGEANAHLILGKPRFRGRGIVSEPPRKIYSLSNAGIAGNTGLIYDVQSRLAVRETTFCWHTSLRKHSTLLAPRFPKATPLPGVALSLVTLSAEGFYHFVHELLPKFFLVKPLLKSVDWIFMNGTENSYHRAWLEYIGIPSSKIIWMSGLSHYHCEQMIFTSQFVSDCQPNTWSVKALLELFEISAEKEGDLWIWASRSDAGWRNLEWEEEILEVYPKFRRISFSKLSPAEAIDICSHCAVFAGPHGAAFSNLIFCPPKTSVIEMFPERWTIKPEYRRLCNLLNFRHSTAVLNFQAKNNLANLHHALDSFLLQTSILSIEQRNK